MRVALVRLRELVGFHFVDRWDARNHLPGAKARIFRRIEVSGLKPGPISKAKPGQRLDWEGMMTADWEGMMTADSGGMMTVDWDGMMTSGGDGMMHPAR
jgi:hypothetical protein